MQAMRVSAATTYRRNLLHLSGPPECIEPSGNPENAAGKS
jgi:hypothetical protein